MKLKTNILFSLLLCGTFATAQNLKLDILPPSVTLGQDSATVSMKMTFNVPQMDTKTISASLLSSQTEPARQNSLKSCSTENVHTGYTAVPWRSTNEEARQM